MDGGFKSFKEQFSRFPPDGTGGQDAIRKFSRTAFPQRKRTAAQPPGDLDPAKSVVYWLTRVSTDPTDPYRQTAGAVQSQSTGKVDDRLVFMQLNTQQVKNQMYYPPDYDPEIDPPYVYFEFSTYSRATYRPKTSGGSEQSFKPYDRGQGSSDDGSSSSRGGGGGGGSGRNYPNPDSFQIISGGLDKKLGTGGTLFIDSANSGGGASIARDDEDNHVNFDNRQVRDIR
jgi:hypothetical protein